MCAQHFGHKPWSHCSGSMMPCRRPPSMALDSPIEVYSCHLWVLDPVGDSMQVACMTTDDWHQVQWADPVLGLVILKMQDRTQGQCSLKQTDPPELWQFLWECSHFKLRWVILYIKILPKDSQEAQFQLELLAVHRETALRGCHHEVGHLDFKQKLDLMCNHLFWPWMAIQAKEHVEKCHQCISFKVKQQWAPMENIVATHSLELVHIDYLCLEPGKGKEENVLVVMDHFTCYAQAYVIWFQMAQTMTKALWDNFIVHYRLLEKILSDQGRNFENQLTVNLCKLMGTKKLRTSLYHPQTNGHCEIFNSTLINVLGTLPPEHKSDLKGSIGLLLHTYISTWNSTTGFSPCFLIYGRQPWLPIAVTLRLTPKLITMPTSPHTSRKWGMH